MKKGFGCFFAFFCLVLGCTGPTTVWFVGSSPDSVSQKQDVPVFAETIFLPDTPANEDLQWPIILPGVPFDTVKFNETPTSGDLAIQDAVSDESDGVFVDMFDSVDLMFDAGDVHETKDTKNEAISSPSFCLNDFGTLSCEGYQIVYQGVAYGQNEKVEIGDNKLVAVIKSIGEGNYDVQFVFVDGDESIAQELSDDNSVNSIIKKWQYDWGKSQIPEFIPPMFFASKMGDTFSEECIGVKNSALVKSEGVALTCENTKNRTVIVVGKKDEDSKEWKGVLRPRETFVSIQWSSILMGKGAWVEFATSYIGDKTILWNDYQDDYKVSLFGAMIRVLILTPSVTAATLDFWETDIKKAVQDNPKALAAANIFDWYEWQLPIIFDLVGLVNPDPTDCVQILIDPILYGIDLTAEMYIEKYSQFDNDYLEFQKAILDKTAEMGFSVAVDVAKCSAKSLCIIGTDGACLAVVIIEKYIEKGIQAFFALTGALESSIAGAIDSAFGGPYCAYNLPFDELEIAPNCENEGAGCSVGIGECQKWGVVKYCSFCDEKCFCSSLDYFGDLMPGDPEAEKCDCKDNDCDGTADNENLCGFGEECENCECQCSAGFVNCASGCVDVNSDKNNCGECGLLCVKDEVCENGKCKLQCSVGLTNCNGKCVDLQNDKNNCNSCGNVCNLANAESNCGQGKCAIIKCYALFADKDKNPLNGCECGVNEEKCNGIDDDCDGKTDEGLSNPCKTDCASGIETCENGEWDNCTALKPKTESCNNIDDDCDGKTDENISVECSNICGSGIQECAKGEWSDCSALQPKVETCNGADDDCDSKVDEGTLCPEGKICSGGKCDSSCKINETYCAGLGCKDLAIDPLNCSDCGNICNILNAESLCQVSQCVIKQCKPNYYDLNKKVVDGCEYQCAFKNAQESCNNLDDNCNGNIDEGVKDACGGCSAMNYKVGEACGCGFWQCDATQLVCVGSETNECGGCSDLAQSGATQGEVCDQCKKWECDLDDLDLNTLVCVGQNQNECGGCGVLAHKPEEICGICGKYVCGDAENTECADIPCVVYYADQDKDGFGTTQNMCLCGPSAPFTAEKSEDCDDDNSNVFPQTQEMKCDGLNEDCDSQTDEDAGLCQNGGICVNGKCCQCASGECCDIDTCLYKSTSTLCGSSTEKVICHYPGQCGNTVEKKVVSKQCDGNSSVCNEISSDWQFYKKCKYDETCSVFDKEVDGISCGHLNLNPVPLAPLSKKGEPLIFYSLDEIVFEWSWVTSGCPGIAYVYVYPLGVEPQPYNWSGKGEFVVKMDGINEIKATDIDMVWKDNMCGFQLWRIEYGPDGLPPEAEPYYSNFDVSPDVFALYKLDWQNCD